MQNNTIFGYAVFNRTLTKSKIY